MQRLGAGSPHNSDLGLGTPVDSSSVCSSRTSDSGVGLGVGGGQIPGLRRMQFPRPVQIHHVMPEPQQQAARPRSLQQQHQQQNQQHQQHQQHPLPLQQRRASEQSPSDSASRSSPSTSATPQSPPPPQAPGHGMPPPPPAYHSNHALLSNLAEHCSGQTARIGLGACGKCERDIGSHTDACHALGKLYHSACFTCACCGRELIGQTFYAVPSAGGGHPSVYCTQDFLYTGFQQAAEKCCACGHMITDHILQALGRPFHPACFRCSVCHCCLDGKPFTVDMSGCVFCVPDYHRVYSPKCYKCHLPITPEEEGSDEVLRVVSMGKDFHLSCYRCQDCGLQLSNESRRRCYPVMQGPDELLLFCYNCRVNRND